MATRAEAAAHIFVTPSMINYLRKKGIVTLEPGGGYDLDKVRRSYIESLRTGKGGSSSIPGLDERDNRGMVRIKKAEELKEELLHEQIRKMKRENDEAEGLLISSDVNVRIISEIVRAIKPHLGSIPSKILRNCPDVTSQLRDVIAKQVARAIDSATEEAKKSIGLIEI